MENKIQKIIGNYLIKKYKAEIREKKFALYFMVVHKRVMTYDAKREFKSVDSLCKIGRHNSKSYHWKRVTCKRCLKMKK